MLNAFLLFGRSPHKPPPPSRQRSYHLEDSFLSPMRYQTGSFPISHVPAVHILLFFSGKCSGRLCTSAPRTAVFRSVKNSFCPTIPLPRFPPLKAFFSSLHTAVFPSALVQFSIERASAFPCSSSP